MAILDDELLDLPDPHLIGDDELTAAFGEGLDDVLNVATWAGGDDLDASYARMRDEVARAVMGESGIKKQTRTYVVERLQERDPGFGFFPMPFGEVERVHTGLLFTGQVECCDGTSVIHDTLPLTVTQVGVCIVAYNGEHNSWVRRTFRRDLQIRSDPVAELAELLTRRDRRSSDMSGRHDQMSELGRRGIMSYAERAILRQHGRGNWYLGHGPALPWELLTGSGHMGLLAHSLEVLEWLWLTHRRAVYVPSSVNRMVLTIGNALNPLEYALVDTLEHDARRVVDRGHYDGAARRRVEDFVRDVASQLVVGVFRAAAQAPAYAFYAHKDYAHLAARIAIADAALQEHRGFPVLIDLADAVCRTTFAGGAFFSVLEGAYADAGAPYAYLPERTTRRHS